MKNITVSVDDTVYRQARIKAAEMDTSVSEMVRVFLKGLGGEGEDFEALKRLEQEARDRIGTFSAADRLARDEVHRRGQG
jgi:hypothetical protein